VVVPNFSVGTFSQRHYRGVGGGPLDDCWAVSDLMALHGCAPHLALISVKHYREKAGVPDTNTGSEGGTLEASLKGITGQWPEIGAMCELYRGPWAGFEAKVKAGHAYSGSVLSASLPHPLGFTGPKSTHRIAGYWNGSAHKILNPLRAPFSVSEEIPAASLRKAFVDYPIAAEVAALIFPTVEEAFVTHPLHDTLASPARIATEDDFEHLDLKLVDWVPGATLFDFRGRVLTQTGNTVSGRPSPYSVVVDGITYRVLATGHDGGQLALVKPGDAGITVREAPASPSG